jgi:hypothetical protein
VSARPNWRAPLYRTRTISRTRRTNVQMAVLEAQILAILEEDHPQSVRHIYYRMTDPRLEEHVEKTESGYRQIQHIVLKLRRQGTLPYGWISDSTRRGYFVNTYRSAGDFLRRVVSLYRADLWQQSEYYVEVWVESRSILGMVQDDCYELAVDSFPCGGFSSATLPFEAATQINETVTKPVVIFYIGDRDPAGVLIDQSVEKELRRHLRPDIDLDFRRLAINRDQIERYDLPTKARKQTDRRRLDILETVEAEAMPAGILRQLLRDEIEKLLPPGALEVTKAAEESERSFLETLGKLVVKHEADAEKD